MDLAEAMLLFQIVSVFATYESAATPEHQYMKYTGKALEV